MKKNCGSGATNKIKTRLACLVNLQDCVWENHYQIIMKIILQEKETIHYSITMWSTNLSLCLKPSKFLQQKKAAVDKECEKLDKISAWNLTKVRSKKEVTDEADGRKSSFCIINGHMSLKKR